jgi:Tfp pilus assembly protein PilZ
MDGKPRAVSGRMLATPTVKTHFDFDDLLDAAPAPANDNQRPQLRAVPRWSMQATLDGASEDALYAGLSYDVATGGIFVATYDHPPIGARVDMTLTLPDGEELSLDGVVRWIRDGIDASDGLPAGCGVECKGMPIRVLRTLEAFAAEREPILWLAEVA